MVYAPILAIGRIIKIVNTNVSMAWIVAVTVVAALTVLITLFGVVFPKFNLMQRLVDKLNLVTRKILTGLRLPVIRAFSRAKHEENRFDDVIHDVSFTARPGQTTAIIGNTGSGKSTIVNLIPRFYDITEGHIFVDGVDVRDVSQHDLREKSGYVPQKGVLFSGNIASNILYGNSGGSLEQMEKAAEIAQVTEFAREKSKRYESRIAQGGSNVSGGQKQRLSIARAIAKSPEIYIFDDSFSALDYKTDVNLRKALKDETADSAVIIVAQRISTILHADQIVVLDNGRIAEIGTHRELLKNSEVYRQIAAAQLSEEELNPYRVHSPMLAS